MVAKKHYFPLSILSFFLLFFGLCSCNSNGASANQDAAKTLTIATAANTQFAIKEIAALFERKYEVKINLIIGSSGKLTAQIQQGAPYDLFLSANTKYPTSLFESGYAPHPPTIYANGQLVLWTNLSTLSLDKELTILEDPAIHKIGIANPKNAPYGEEAIHVLQYFGVYSSLKAKLVYGESIAQATQFIASGNCELGITAKSIVSSPIMQGKGQWIDLPIESYQPIQQGVVITKYGASNQASLAQAFFDFLFTEDAQGIFRNFGYTTSQ